MLRIRVEDQPKITTLYVEGKLAGDCVDELRKVWVGIRADSPNKETVIDLCSVRFVDSAGRKLLCQMHGWGARLAGHSLTISPLIEEITSAKSCTDLE